MQRYLLKENTIDFYRGDSPVSPSVSVKACFKTTTGVTSGTTGATGSTGSSGTTVKKCDSDEGMDNPAVCFKLYSFLSISFSNE